MQYKEAVCILFAESKVLPGAYVTLKRELGCEEFHSDAEGTLDSRLLIEVGGRLCYKSFDLSLNKNLSRIREGNELYIGNILSQKHGSVLEHGTVTFVLLDVSRILTHELVRHRAGTAYSQESGRFVRIDQVNLYKPDALQEEYIKEHLGDLLGGDRDAMAQVVANRLRVNLDNVAKQFEQAVKEAALSLMLDSPKMPFRIKKAITSALRRWAPSGLLTNIMVTCNHRTWRHLIETRTMEGAEEEIVKVFTDIGWQLYKHLPEIYQDMIERVNPDGSKSLRFTNSKI